jgi:branched-chain amino acid transport system substrate-binding protein
MADVLFTAEVTVPASREAVYASFGGGRWADWIFDAHTDELRPGRFVKVAFPVAGVPLAGVARVHRVLPDQRIVLRVETPWHGRVIIDFEPDGANTRVRVVTSVEDGSIAPLARLLGGDLADDPDEQVVRIGLLTSYSGSAGVFGPAVENCARLAVNEINAENGVNGLPLRLIVADDATSPTTGLRELKRLHLRHHVDMVIAVHTSATLDAVRPYARRVDLPYFYTPVNEGGKPSGRLFRWGEVPDDQLRQAVPAMMREHGGKGWYVVGNDYVWPRAVGACARGTVEAEGGRMLGERYVPLSTTDFDEVLESIEETGAELVVNSLVGGDAAAFERQLHAAGLRRQVRSFGALLDEATRDHIGDEAAEGMWSVLGYFMDLPTPENQEFLRRYRAAFGPAAPPVSSVTESVYEGIHLYARAAKAAGAIEPASLVGALPGVGFTGPRGEVTVTPSGRLRQPLYLAEAVAGGFRIRAEQGLAGID